MSHRVRVEVVSWLVASVLFMPACGGGSGSANGSSAGSGGQGAAGSSSTADGATCSQSQACAPGYVCIPTGNANLTTVVDTNCLNSCNTACDMAGPVKDTCLQACMDVCKTQAPAGGATAMGTCQRVDNTNNTGAAGSSGSSGGSAGSTSYSNSFVWSGTWTADVSHTSNCSWSSAMQTGKQSYTVTITATGDNSAPKAAISGGFSLDGTGGSDHISLTGDFPFRSWKGEVATTNSLNSPNNATIKITSIESATKISGTIEGSWDAGGGWTCTAASGTITLSR